MSSTASQWPCPQPPTTASTRWRLVKSTAACRHRGWTGPGGCAQSSTETEVQSSRRCRALRVVGVLAGRRSGSSGTMWSRLSTSCGLLPWCVFSMFLCRRWWNSCQTSSSSSPRVAVEPVFAVPKIFSEDIPTRTLAREPQLAEQLVEVPTILFFLKQTVETPVPRGRGRLQGFLPDQNPTAQLAEQLVDIPVFGGGLQGFRPGQGSTASSSSSVSRSPTDWLNTAGEAFQGFFSHFFPTR